jgi:Potential Queuosine, Q, salvage protein family
MPAIPVTLAEPLKTAEPRLSTLRDVVRAAGIPAGPHLGVTVDETVLAGIAAAVREGAAAQGGVTRCDDPRFWPTEADSATRIQLLAVGNAVNFRFWRRTDDGLQSLGGHIGGEWFGGSMYLWRRLVTRFRDDFPVASAEFWAHADRDAFLAVFADDTGASPLGEGADDRVANLVDLGTRLLADWEGSFERVCTAADGSLVRFLALSGGFRAFDDPLRKLALVNAIMLRGSGLASFVEAVPPAIDYQLTKHLLRFGLLAPETALAEKLRDGRYLDASESLRLRSAALAALLRVSEASGVPGDLLDNLLWHNRTICRDEAPDCDRCPYNRACQRRTELGRPLELTRYY